MKLGILDLGSNTVHLQIIDAHRGAKPVHNSSVKHQLRLIDFTDENGAVSPQGVETLHKVITDSLEKSKEYHLDEIIAFATSALREATNGKEIISEINKIHNLNLQVLSGVDEAELTFLAVRRWLGWSSGDLLVLDIGGGSLEIAAGSDELPDAAKSYFLGAARLTREFLKSDPFTEKSLDNLSKYLDSAMVDISNVFGPYSTHKAIGTSKTFRTLARLTSDFLGDPGRTITRKSLELLYEKISKMSIEERSNLPRVSAFRADQIVAGSLVALKVMQSLDLNVIEISPWALREGIVLNRIDIIKF